MQSRKPEKMGKMNRANFSLIGTSILGAAASTSCCWGPALLAGTAGIIGSASWFNQITKFRPYLMGISVISLSIAFRRIYRQPRKSDFKCDRCVENYKKKQGIMKVVLWLAVVLVAGSFYRSYGIGGMRTNAVQASVQQPFRQALVANTAGKEVSLNIHGMGCWRCAHRIDHTVSGMSGVLHVVVSLKDSSGIFRYDNK